MHFACLKRENGFPKVAVGLVRNVARQGGRQVKALFLCHLLKDADDLGTLDVVSVWDIQGCRDHPSDSK